MDPVDPEHWQEDEENGDITIKIKHFSLFEGKMQQDFWPLVPPSAAFLRITRPRKFR